MEDEERDDGVGVVIAEAQLEIEAISRLRPATDVHFARQELRWVEISLPRVKWLERAEVQ